MLDLQLRRRLRVAALAVAVLALLYSVNWRASAADMDPTHVVGSMSDDCLQGFSWPAHVLVRVALRDSSGSVLYSDRPRTDGNGDFEVPSYGGTGCDLPVHLRPGMSVTASDGSETKTVVLEDVTFDQLDPVANTAAGTAPPGRQVDVFIYGPTAAGASPKLLANAQAQTDATGHWFIDVRAAGGTVENQGFADVFVYDEDGDQTTNARYGTAVTLSASIPASGASLSRVRGSRALVVAPGTHVLLSGRLRAQTRRCVGRKRVVLLKVKGKRTKILKAARSRRSGRYRFLFEMRRTTGFRVRFRGNRGCQRSRSRVRVVRVVRP